MLAETLLNTKDPTCFIEKLKRNLWASSEKKYAMQNVEILERMFKEEPLKQFAVKTENKYVNSKQVEAIEQMFARHGNKEYVDAKMKKTTKVYIDTKKDQHARQTANQTTWDITQANRRCYK